MADQARFHPNMPSDLKQSFVDNGDGTYSPKVSASVSVSATNMQTAAKGTTPQGNPTSTSVDANTQALDVYVRSAGAGGTSSADGAAYAAGTTGGTPLMLARDDTSPGTLAEDKVGIARGSTRRELYTQLRDAAGNERGANVTAAGALQTDSSGTTQPVSGTVAATQSGTWTVQPGNTANTTAWKVDGSAVTQPVSGTVTANAGSGTFGTNLAQVAGTTTDTNSGVKSAGTQRVVIATDQPQLTNKLLVTPDANAQVDVNRIAGTATDVNSGNKSAGTQRVVLATDQPQLTNALKVDASATTQPVSGTVTANQGGTWTVQPGNTANTTAWKVDGSAVTQPVSGTVTANVATGGGKTPLFASVSVASSGANQIVAADVAKKIKVVSYVLVADAAVTAKWQSAANDKSGAMSLAANGGVSAIGSFDAHIMETAVNEALNLNLGSAVGVRGHISYFLET